MTDLEKKYDKILRQVRIWNEGQSWTKQSMTKYLEMLLDECCPEAQEPAGTRFDAAVKELRAIKRSQGTLTECFTEMYRIIDAIIPEAKKELAK